MNSTNAIERLAAEPLPTDRVQNHAANLLALPNGEILCVWFAGTMEGRSDISIYLSRRNPRGGWSDPVQLSDDPARSEQNPVLFLAPGGALWLLYTAQPGGNQQQSVIRCRVSADLGQSWSAPRRLFEEEGLFVRQPIVVTDEGSWLLPVFRCRVKDGEVWTGENDDSAVMVTRDGGASWSRVPVPQSMGCVHMNILKLGGRRLVAFFRSRWADNVYVSRSEDAGESWSVPERTPLPNNNSSIQAVGLVDGRIAMAFNRSSAAGATGRRLSLYDDLDDKPAPAASSSAAFWGAPRAPLSLALSHDCGRTWPTIVDIATSDGYCLSNESANGTNRELSYPSIIQTEDGAVHIAYTHFRQTIRYLRLTEKELSAAAADET